MAVDLTEEAHAGVIFLRGLLRDNRPESQVHLVLEALHGLTGVHLVAVWPEGSGPFSFAAQVDGQVVAIEQDAEVVAFLRGEHDIAPERIALRLRHPLRRLKRESQYIFRAA